jgi:rubrerythrin
MREMPMPHPPYPMPYHRPCPCKCPQPDRDYYTYPANLDEALRMIEEAVMGETGDVKFYEGLMKICEKMCDKEDMKIFEGIIADEHKHAQLFRTIYCEITGHVLPEAPMDKAKAPKIMLRRAQEAIFDELNAVEKIQENTIRYAKQKAYQYAGGNYN